jgi:hypothetical protein
MADKPKKPTPTNESSFFSGMKKIAETKLNQKNDRDQGDDEDEEGQKAEAFECFWVELMHIQNALLTEVRARRKMSRKDCYDFVRTYIEGDINFDFSTSVQDILESLSQQLYLVNEIHRSDANGQISLTELCGLRGKGKAVYVDATTQAAEFLLSRQFPGELYSYEWAHDKILSVATTVRAYVAFRIALEKKQLTSHETFEKNLGLIEDYPFLTSSLIAMFVTSIPTVPTQFLVTPDPDCFLTYSLNAFDHPILGVSDYDQQVK